VQRANAGGAGGDGLLQRFGLLVWPDKPGDWHDVDQYPDRTAKEAAWGVFDRASRLDPPKLGATVGTYDKVPCFRFDDAAHDEFLQWRTDLEKRLRAGEMSPALEGHLAKYRKLVPALALLNHVADQGQGDVSHQAVLKALAFASYLETHARRVYGCASTQVERLAATAILRRIRKGDLKEGFTLRDVHQRSWANLADRDHVRLGLDLLIDLDHIDAVQTTTGGRPKVTHSINPRTLG
jgi:putative DNA primase/helicase